MLMPGNSSGSVKGLEARGAGGDSGIVGGRGRRAGAGPNTDLDWLLVLRGT